MKVSKIIETRLDISSIDNIFCSDYDKTILNLLANKFQNRCYKSVFITSIDKIIKRSKMHCKNKLLDGSIYVDIMFECTAIIYEKQEVIHNCKIIQINNNGIMHAKATNTSLQIKNIDGVNIFKENEEIPVIVKMARYNIFEDEISVSAVPLIPIIQDVIIFKIKNQSANSKNDYSKDDYSKDLADINDLEKKLKDIKTKNKSVYNFFRELLYPYKTFQKYKSIEISIKVLESLKENQFVYKPISYLDNNVIVIENENENNQVLIIEQHELINRLLFEYKKNLLYFLGFLENYNSEEKIKNKSSVWALYKHLKENN